MRYISLMNFAETLTYWYLRLNGFFPITNFILHKGSLIPRSADSDLLAVRFPYVFEEVGGQPKDWDTETFANWGINLERDIVGIIVEVKTGYEDNPGELEKGINRAFREGRLVSGIQRLGFWDRDKAAQVGNQLVGQTLYREPVFQLEDGNTRDFVIAKMLVETNLPHGLAIPPCLALNLLDLKNFIDARVDEYIKRKYADRMGFPSDLLQYIIWSRKNA
jgi:hypothetical protein